MYKQRPIKLLYGLSSCISWPRSKLLTNAIKTPPSNDARAITGCLSSEETAQQNNWAVGSTDESRFANFCSSLPWRGSQNLKIRKHCLRIQDHYIQEHPVRVLFADKHAFSASFSKFEKILILFHFHKDTIAVTTRSYAFRVNVAEYSQLPLNGHLVKADISLKRTRGVGPCHTSVIYFISLQGGHLSKADSWSWSRACPP